MSNETGIEIIRCAACDVEIILRPERVRVLRTTHATFHCPNGHSQSFTGATPLERENAALKSRAESAEAAAKRARDELERVRNEARLNANACRACKRRFQTPEKLQSHVRIAHGKTLALPATAGREP